jgi:uncharacterized protein (DUF2141 family)
VKGQVRGRRTSDASVLFGCRARHRARAWHGAGCKSRTVGKTDRVRHRRAQRQRSRALRALFLSGRFREPGHELRGAVAQIKNGLAACVFNGLPAGTYAVAVFHAEHNETQMETGLFGKPKQGYGFSNNPASTFGPPSFNSAAFEYRGGSLNLPVQLSY